MAKFNAKKLFKGENAYLWNDDKFTYAVSSKGYIAVRMLNESDIVKAVQKDAPVIEFANRIQRERVTGAVDKVFDPDIKEIEAKRLRLDVETIFGPVYLFDAVKGNHGCMGVQGRWVDALGDLKDWTPYLYGDAVKFYSQGAEIVMMRYKFEGSLNMEEVEAFEAEIEEVKNYLKVNK